MELQRSVEGHQPHDPPRSLGVLAMGPGRKEDEISFKEHFEERLASQQKLEDERWDAHEKVHAMGQLAIDASVKALDARLETMNQFRAQISNERGEFVKQEVYNSEYKAFEVRVGKIENIQSNQAGRTAAYTSGVGIIFIMLQIFLHFVWK
jgi:hypothetical protein